MWKICARKMKWLWYNGCMNEGQTGNGGIAGGASDGFDSLNNGGMSGESVGYGAGPMMGGGVPSGVPVGGAGVGVPVGGVGMPVGGMPVSGANVPGGGVGVPMGRAGTPMNMMQQTPMPMSQDTGDIVLSSGGREKSKKGLIIGIIVGVVVLVAVGVVGVMLLPNVIKTKEKTEEKLGMLVNYLEKGDADGDVNSDVLDSEWVGSNNLIYAVAIHDATRGDISDYYDKMGQLKADFLDNVIGVGDDLLSEYKDTLKVLGNLINYRDIEDKLRELYINGGEEAIKLYYNDEIQCESVGSDLMVLCLTEEEYYDAIMAEYMLYSNSGCYDDEIFDDVCAREYAGKEKFDELTNHVQLARGSFGRLRDDRNYSLLSSEVVESNKMMKEALNDA